MRQRARAAATLLLLGFAVTAGAAELFGQWVPVTGLNDAARLQAAHLRKARCLPQAAEVGMPGYPGAVIIAIDWGRVRPACAARDGWTDLGGITLVTTDPPARVMAWYSETLPGYHRYAAPAGEVLIAAEIGAFLWERDYYKYPNIAIAPVAEPWLSGGYLTRIELNRPAPDAAPLAVGSAPP